MFVAVPQTEPEDNLYSSHRITVNELVVKALLCDASRACGGLQYVYLYFGWYDRLSYAPVPGGDDDSHDWAQRCSRALLFTQSKNNKRDYPDKIPIFNLIRLIGFYVQYQRLCLQFLLKQ